MVEQNALIALELYDRAYVFEQRRIAKTGTGAELLHDPHVKTAYLGIGDAPVHQSQVDPSPVDQVPSLNRGSLS
jgi:hypothetical protein